MSTEPLKVVLINAYGPSIITPDIYMACANLPMKIHYIYAAVLSHIRPHVPPSVWQVDCKRNLWECTEAIEHIKPDLIHVQDNSLYNDQLAPLIRSGLSKYPFIYEPCDLLSSLFIDEDFMKADGRSAQDAAFGSKIEHWMLTASDGVIHMDNGPQIDRIMQETKAHHLEYQAYLPKSRCVFHNRSEVGDPVRLFWAGGIAPNTAPDEIRGENKLLNFFKSLIDQGCSVTAYNPLAKNEAQLKQQYAEYLDFAAREPHFQIFPCQPRETLVEILSREADFGMHLYPKPPNDEARAPMYQSSMAGKVFTYLSAGVPMLTVDFLGPISRFTKAHGTGISIGENQFNDIGRILKACNYPALKERVKQVQQAMTAEANTPRLERFILNAIAKAGQRGAQIRPEIAELAHRAN